MPVIIAIRAIADAVVAPVTPSRATTVTDCRFGGRATGPRPCKSLASEGQPQATGEQVDVEDGITMRPVPEATGNHAGAHAQVPSAEEHAGMDARQ